MVHRVFQNGKHQLTIQSTDGSSCDIVVMPKSLVQQCSMTSRGFEELFFIFLKEDISHTEAYEKAEQVHENYFEKRKYSSYESFKAVQYRDHKK